MAKDPDTAAAPAAGEPTAAATSPAEPTVAASAPAAADSNPVRNALGLPEPAPEPSRVHLVLTAARGDLAKGTVVSALEASAAACADFARPATAAEVAIAEPRIVRVDTL